MFSLYIIRLCLRLPVFCAAVYLYLARRQALLDLLKFDSLPAYITWAALMAGMIWHFLPNSRLSLAGRKQFGQNYRPRGYRREDLAAYVRTANRRAGMVLLLWVAAHALIFGLYAQGIIGAAELLLLCAAYYVGDVFCITLFCPFRRWVMRCRCCVDCRIFDWGHMMMYTPLIPLGGIFARSLCICGCVVFLLWELRFARHPQRFWPGGNAALSCAGCKAKLCFVKKRQAA